jgi:hypothetical protein
MGKTFKTDYGCNSWNAVTVTAKEKSRVNRTLRHRLHSQANDEIKEHFKTNTNNTFNKSHKYSFIQADYYHKSPRWTHDFKHNGTKSWNKLHNANNCISNFSMSCIENNDGQYSCLHHGSKITDGVQKSCIETNYSTFVKNICDKQMKRRNETGKKYLFDRIKRQKNGAFDKDVYNPQDNIHEQLLIWGEF